MLSYVVTIQPLGILKKSVIIEQKLLKCPNFKLLHIISHVQYFLHSK